MSIVVVESPFSARGRDEQEKFRWYLNECMRALLLRGYSPMASHRLYTEPLDDRVPDERKLGIEAGLAFYEVATHCVVCGAFGRSTGMVKGIEHAKSKGVTVVEFDDLMAQ